MSIIYLRKVLMQEFHFSYIKNKYGNKSNYYSLIFMKVLVVIQLGQNIIMIKTI